MTENTLDIKESLLKQLASKSVVVQRILKREYPNLFEHKWFEVTQHVHLYAQKLPLKPINGYKYARFVIIDLYYNDEAIAYISKSGLKKLTNKTYNVEIRTQENAPNLPSIWLQLINP